MTPEDPGAVAAAAESRWQRRAERERRARLAAEEQAENGLRQLYQQQRQLRLLQVTAAAANAATSPEDALGVCLAEFCAYAGWPVGHACLVSRQRPGAIVPTKLWHFEQESTFAPFRELTEGVCLLPGVGLPGRAVARGQPVWIDDLSADADFLRRDGAREAELRSGLAFPIMIESEVAAVLEFYSRDQKLRDPALVALAAKLGTVLGRVFERQRAQEALREAGAQLEERVRVRTQELATANERLAKSARMKDEFLANMSHELRTPLNTILGMTETLQEGLLGALTDRQGDSLRLIAGSSRQLLGLINDILDVSRIEAGRMKLEVEEVSVEPICQAVLRLWKGAAQEKRLIVELRVAPEAKSIHADERRLKQMLGNLLNNAVKFTPAGGRIGLEVSAVESEGIIQFTVWDTGIGIPPEDQIRVFESFVQADGGLSRPYNGTGLGLNLVSRIAALHRGRVTVVSEPGRGSRFTLSLPCQFAPQPANPSIEPAPAAIELPRPAATLAPVQTPSRPIELPPEPSASTGPVILLADDHEVNRGLLHLYLSQKGFNVIEAEGGQRAVELAQSRRPDLILMDTQMPGVDGFEATRLIRAQPENGRTPIIALTAMSMPGDRERFLAAGYCDHLGKPVDFSKIAATIRKHLVIASSSSSASSTPKSSSF